MEQREFNTVTAQTREELQKTSPHIPEVVEAVDAHELRQLRWQNKAMNKQCGKQGETIHLLRAELAEVREINGKIARDYVRELERQARADATRIYELQARNQRLAEQWVEMRDKLDAAEGAGSYEFDQSYEPDPQAAGHDYSDGPPVS